MIYLSGDGFKLIVLEPENLEEIKKGRPVVSPDKSVMIAWTPDPVWLADKIMDSEGDAALICKLIDEAAKRPEKAGRRPYHETHTGTFTKKES